MPPNNYLDFGKGSDLTKPIITLLDQEDSQNPGSLLRFMRLAQINNSQSALTAYLTNDSWGCLYIPSSGIVGESKFLIDGADIKSRLNFEPWTSNPLRIKATKRKDIELQCLLNLNRTTDLVDKVESPLYSGNYNEFQLPPQTWDDSTIGYINDPFKFRKRLGILNVFSKYSNDKNHRYVWFHLENNQLAVYGSEHSGGDTGISIIRIAFDINGPFLDQETNRPSFSIPARHLSKVLSLVSEHSPLAFRLDTEGKLVHFWSNNGWFILPTKEKDLSRTLGFLAPPLMNHQLSLEKTSQRMYSAQELAHKVAIQKPRQKSDAEGLRLECTDTYLVITKVSDLLRRDLTYAMFADLTGEESPWQPLVVYQTYFFIAITATLKYCKQLTDDELFESGGTGNEEFIDSEDFGDLDDYLSLANETNYSNSHLLTLTQEYSPKKDMWCLFIDPVPYSGEFTIYLATSLPAQSYDRSEDNL